MLPWFVGVVLATGVPLFLLPVFVGVVLVVDVPLFMLWFVVVAVEFWPVIPPHAASKTASSTIIANGPER
jgi:hypothetical protein